nr:SHOCT domain-containing protein [uncultured Niameybacter sp.]
MLVTKIEGDFQINKKQHQFTKEELQNEYQYVMAQSILKKMLCKGLISSDEFQKITVLNRQSFCPSLARIMATHR